MELSKKIFLVSLVLVSMVAGASATLGTPNKVQVKACNNFFNDCTDSQKVITFEWTDNTFDSSEVIVSSDDISSRIDTGKVKNSFRMSIEGSTSSAEYTVRDGGFKDLYKVDARTNSFGWCLSSICSAYPQVDSEEEYKSQVKDWVRSHCADLDNDGYISWSVDYWTEGLLGDIQRARAYCVAQGGKYANVGDISTDYKENMATKFNVGGISKTLSNTDIGKGKTANFGDQVKINFRGGLESGYNFPVPDDSLVAYNDQRFNGFRIIKQSNVEAYKNYLSQVESKDEMTNWMQGETSESEIEDISMNELQNAVEKYSGSELLDHSFEFIGDSLKNGVIKVTGNRQYSYPSFQVFVKGDKLKYYIPEATPTFEGATVEDNNPDDSNNYIEEGSSGDLKISVGNKETATAEGDFTVRVTSCTQGFTASSLSPGVSPQPGQTQTVSIPVSYGLESDSATTSGSCTVEIKNLRDTSETITREVSLTGEQSNDCTPGRYSVKYNSDGTKTIYKCGSSGQTKEKVATCGSEERVKTLSDGTKTCVKKTDKLVEKCGDNKDNDADGKIDENCKDEPEDQDDDSTKKVWIPTQGGTRCISQTVSSGTVINPSYSSKSKCQSAIGGSIGCAITTPNFVPFTEAEEVEFICGKNKVYANILLTLMIGLVGVGTGRKLGSAIDPEDSNTATLIGATSLGILGGIIGFAFISVAQAIGFILVSALVYGVYKFIMIYTGAEAVKDLITE